MTKQWSRAALPGCYISVDGKYTAELRKPGFSADFNCNMARHYVIRLRYQDAIIGTALTLSDAAREYLALAQKEPSFDSIQKFLKG